MLIITHEQLQKFNFNLIPSHISYFIVMPDIDEPIPVGTMVTDAELDFLLKLFQCTTLPDSQYTWHDVSVFFQLYPNSSTDADLHFYFSMKKQLVDKHLLHEDADKKILTYTGEYQLFELDNQLTSEPLYQGENSSEYEPGSMQTAATPHHVIEAKAVLYQALLARTLETLQNISRDITALANARQESTQQEKWQKISALIDQPQDASTREQKKKSDDDDGNHNDKKRKRGEKTLEERQTERKQRNACYAKQSRDIKRSIDEKTNIIINTLAKKIKRAESELSTALGSTVSNTNQPFTIPSVTQASSNETSFTPITFPLGEIDTFALQSGISTLPSTMGFGLFSDNTYQKPDALMDYKPAVDQSVEQPKITQPSQNPTSDILAIQTSLGIFYHPGNDDRGKQEYSESIYRNKTAPHL